MKRKGWPLWLLRDVPAFLSVMISFWPLVILVITSVGRAMRGGKIRRPALEALPALVAHAEARLVFSLWRQAYRRLGWNHRLVKFNLIPSTDNWDDTQERCQNYLNAFRDMNAVVDAYLADIREQYSISEREVASASARAPVRTPLVTRSKSSLAVRRGRWRATSSSRDDSSRRSAAKAEGGCVRSRARGPPFHPKQFQKTSPTPPQRTRV